MLDFAFAKKRSRVSKLAVTTQKRSNALRDVIELDYVHYDMFDLAPIAEYRRYIMAFGQSNSKQVCGHLLLSLCTFILYRCAVCLRIYRCVVRMPVQVRLQTNDDNVDRDLQTEEIERSEKWTQQPPEDIRGCGGPNDNKVAVATDDGDDRFPLFDTMTMNKFVSKASAVRFAIVY